jgi:hypothetical protein
MLNKGQEGLGQAKGERLVNEGKELITYKRMYNKILTEFIAGNLLN